MKTDRSEQPMIPREDRSRIVAALITRTQAGTLRWEPIDYEADTGANGIMSPRRGLLPRSAISESQNYLESSADGLRFRLSVEDRGVNALARLASSLPGSTDLIGIVLLTIIDGQNPMETEELRENEGLPILRDLYQLATGQNKNLKKKIDRFLGNPSR